MDNQTLQELQKKLAQKKAKIHLKEKMLKEKERRIRTKRLIELGGLIAKVKMDQLDNNTLLGALLELRNEAQDEKILKRWTDLGFKTFEKSKKDSRKPTIVTFAKKPSQEIKDLLKHLGLRWNPFRNEWQGYADEKLVKESLAKSGGKVEIIH